jgi:hypothetical protein
MTADMLLGLDDDDRAGFARDDRGRKTAAPDPITTTSAARSQPDGGCAFSTLWPLVAPVAVIRRND